MKAFFELPGFIVKRLTGARRKGTRRRPRDSRRTRITGILPVVGVVGVVGVAGALAVYGLVRSADDAPLPRSSVGAAPTDEGTTPEESGSREEPIRPVPTHAMPTTSRPTAVATVTPEPTHSEVASSVLRGVRKGASCSPAGAVGYTSSGRRVTCQGPGRVRWR